VRAYYSRLNDKGVEDVKGFIFSIDAMGAIAVIAALGIAWVFLVQQETGETGQHISRIARDSAMTDMYTGAATTETLDTTQTYSYCKNYYTYNAGSLTKVDERMNCEEMS